MAEVQTTIPGRHVCDARLGLMDYWKQYGPADDCGLRDDRLICR